MEKAAFLVVVLAVMFESQALLTSVLRPLPLPLRIRGYVLNSLFLHELMVGRYAVELRWRALPQLGVALLVAGIALAMHYPVAQAAATAVASFGIAFTSTSGVSYVRHFGRAHLAA